MQAAVFRQLGCPLEIEQVADPRPAGGQVVVDVVRCGICGSDLHMSEEAGFGMLAGTIMGHEFAGEVVECGSDVTSLHVGDLVAVNPIRGCGHCQSCLAGEPAWCAKMLLQSGGYGEFALASVSQCVVLPNGLTFADGAIVEPVAVALHGVNMSGLKAGAKVIVVGAGPIGLAVAFWARRRGASQILVVDVADYQRDRAMALGATQFIVTSDDPVGAVQAALPGGADIVFECVGAPGLVAQCLAHLAVKGTVVLLGLCSRPDTFVPFHAVAKEARIQSSAFFTQQEYEASLRVIESGAFELRDLVTQTVDLGEVPVVFESLKRRSGQCKVLISHK